MDKVIDFLLGKIGGGIVITIIVTLLSCVIGFGAVIVFKGNPVEEKLIETAAEEVIKYETGLDVDLHAVVEDVEKVVP